MFKLLALSLGIFFPSLMLASTFLNNPYDVKITYWMHDYIEEGENYSLVYTVQNNQDASYFFNLDLQYLTTGIYSIDFKKTTCPVGDSAKILPNENCQYTINFQADDAFCRNTGNNYIVGIKWGGSSYSVIEVKHANCMHDEVK